MRYHFGDRIRGKEAGTRTKKRKAKEGKMEGRGQLKETRIKRIIENREWKVKNVTEKKNEN